MGRNENGPERAAGTRGRNRKSSSAPARALPATRSTACEGRTSPNDLERHLAQSPRECRSGRPPSRMTYGIPEHVSREAAKLPS